MGTPAILKALRLDPLTQNHIEKTLLTVPVPVPYHNDVSAIYEQKHDESLRDANLYFLDLQEKIAPSFNLSDDALQIRADRLARECGSIVRKTGISDALLRVSDFGIGFPTASNEKGIERRLSCPIWWKRQLIKKHDREQELFALKIGIVGRLQLYCSDASHKRILARQEASRLIMAKKEAVYGEGSADEEIINMLDLLDGSLANPKNRFAEIYTRAKGFETYGDENGHSCQLITITCPSRMHPSSDKWDGTTPREAQRHLRELWNRANANLKDNDIYPYGFRVAEAHKDGCPHWHVWIYVESDKQAKLNSILEDHALRVDGNEAGAEKYRIDFEAIDLSKGSASSYLFKYISKNLDGNGSFEVDGKDSTETAPRVKSWASIWGTRQIQQVGGSSVGVWRELRRCDDELTGLLEEARICANAGDWNGYFKIQGGHLTPRQEQPIKTLKQFNVNTETGELELNYYDEPIERVKGLVCEDQEVITRLKEWTIRDIKTDERIIESSRSINDLLQPVTKSGGGICDPWIISSNSRNQNTGLENQINF